MNERIILLCIWISSFNQFKTVILKPCKHRFGNFCANQLKILESNCPICRDTINTFEGLVEMIERPDDILIKRFEEIKLQNSNLSMREFSPIEINQLRDGIINNTISDANLCTRYYYLRQGQIPDEELLRDIIVLPDFYKFHPLAVGLRYLIHNFPIDIQLEHCFYMTMFKLDLITEETDMLRHYYDRNGYNSELEISMRPKYRELTFI